MNVEQNLKESISQRQNSGMRPGSNTDDYRKACEGEGGFGSLGYEWADKPHRLVYDLCGEIDRLRAQIEDMKIEYSELREQIEIKELD